MNSVDRNGDILVDSDKKVNSFNRAFRAFILGLAIFVAIVGMAFIVRSESFKQSCEEVQDNNQIFRTYIKEQKIKAKIRYEENPIEGFTLEEVEKSYDPLIHNLRRVKC